MKQLISICIPTYNRAKHLSNCLESIIKIRDHSSMDFEVCISDNGSVDNTEEVVRAAQKRMPVKYKKNSTNLGIPQNFLNVVAMAEGEFAWLIGDDDLLLPDTIERLHTLISNNPGVDFFYVNSFHLQTEFVLSYPQPFDTMHLPVNMMPFSSYTKNGQMPFLDLINPKISFDFLGGMFLSVFRRQMWMNNTDVLNKNAIADLRVFSHFDNTFPHVKIFAKAYSGSVAYFNSKPLSVCLTGAREWSPMYPFVQSVRLVEALDEYRSNGLSYYRYLKCRNAALHNFLPDLASMIIHRKKSGFCYVSMGKLIFPNCFFPNFYLSVIYFAVRKLTYIFGRTAR